MSDRITLLWLPNKKHVISNEVEYMSIKFARKTCFFFLLIFLIYLQLIIFIESRIATFQSYAFIRVVNNNA